MNARCVNDDGSFKACPYRVITEEHKAIAVGTGDCVTQRFYPCLGENCAGYHAGICLRLQGVLTAGEVEHGQK